ncbi:hypothetical protein FQN54_005600 [Arachnomyces sp. PD_36]|nr:hypothetical protein FQN54_005600 [Arachnomyces sp. PD_36]
MLYATTALCLAGLASAHTTLQYAFVDSTETDGIVRMVSTNNPIQDVTSSDMACNVGGTSPAGSTAEVAAGGTVSVEWHHESRDSEAIADSHKGPILTYLGATGSAASESDPSSLSWFKIAETGLDGSTWAVDTLIANGGKWDVTIPSGVPEGEYLLRNEIIALHSAYDQGGAQFYVGCVQIKVTGGGSGSPETVTFPGAYSADDPGILVQIYGSSGEPIPDNGYQIPGPAVFSG